MSYGFLEIEPERLDRLWQISRAKSTLRIASTVTYPFPRLAG